MESDFSLKSKELRERVAEASAPEYSPAGQLRTTDYITFVVVGLLLPVILTLTMWPLT